jgi:siroheme synthase
VRRRLTHLARGAETIVLFMAGTELAAVRRTLLNAGLPGATPAALIESGTLPEQRAGFGTLDDLPALLGEFRGGPVLAIVGATVALAASLAAPLAAGARSAALAPASSRSKGAIG